MLDKIRSAWNKYKAERNLSKGKNTLRGVLRGYPGEYEVHDAEFDQHKQGEAVDLNPEYKEVIPTYYDENGEPRTPSWGA